MNETAEAPAERHPERKRLPIGWLLTGLLLGAAVAAVATSFLLTAAVLNSDLAAQIRRTTGFSTEIGGPARFSLLPQPHIDIDKISFANPKAALRIDVPNFTGYLRLVPLLAGRVEVGHAVLYQPKMLIDLDVPALSPESTIGQAAETKSASPQAAVIDRAQLAVVDLVGGTARLHRRGAADLFFDDIDITADWRSLEASATLTGQFSFGQVPMQLKAWLGQPVELLRGGSSAVTLQLDSEMLKLVTTGEVTTAAHFQYHGNLSASTPSLRGLGKLAGFTVGKTGRFGEFDLHCDANVNAPIATLANVRLHLDDNDYEGSLAVETDDKMLQLSGTLATNRLDLAPFLDGLPRPADRSGHWNDAPIELSDLGFTNLDLRLSASRLRLNDIEVKDAAVSLLTRPGFIDLALGEASANGGMLKGRLTLSGAGPLDLRASAVGDGIDLEPMWPSSPTGHPLSGTLSGEIMVESKGASFAALMHGFSGHAQIAVANGQLVGVDLVDALRGNTHGLFPRQGVDNRVTPFDHAKFSAQIAQGMAHVGDGEIAAENLAIRFGGTADIGARLLDIWAKAEAQAPSGQPADTAPAAISMTLKGPWDDLHAAVDRASLNGANPVPQPADATGAAPAPQ